MEPICADNDYSFIMQVDTVAEQVTDAQLFSVDRVPPEASAGLGMLHTLRGCFCLNLCVTV